jgi:ketosteroid isomerase-like protein
MQSSIETLSSEYEGAVQARNISAIADMYTNRPKFLPPGGDMPRWDNPPEERWSQAYIKTYWHDIFQITEGGFKYIQTMRDVEVLADAAREIGIYDLRMSNDEDEIEAGTYFVLWQRENEKWKIAVHILNSRSRPKWARASDVDS